MLRIELIPTLAKWAADNAAESVGADKDPMVILGFLSDAHGNVEAFQQGLDELKREGAERVFFLGDAVGYLPGDGVIQAIRMSDVSPILGNHDDMLLRDRVDPARDRIYRLADTADSLSPENRTYLETWPHELELVSPCGPLLMVHGTPEEPLTGRLYPEDDLSAFVDGRRRAVFMGQTHRPFVRSCDETLFVNVGSCGLPRDCGNLGSACVFDDSSGSARVIRYDIQASTEQALARCGAVAPEVLEVFNRRAPDGCFET